jgi:membrane-bound lytic murein transglycosylase B
VAILALGLSFSLASGALCAAEDPFTSLKGRLVADGLSDTEVRKAFNPPPASQLKIVARTLQIREGKLNYDQFLDQPAVAKAREFLNLHQRTFARAEEVYKVDRPVIAAILLVETRFGSYTGKTPTLGVLSTFALMDKKQYRDKVWALLEQGDRVRWGREEFDRKLESRAKWAYDEISALIRWTELQKTRADSFSGSVMGAVGWPQFLPSSMVRFAQDGNGDGRIDLYEPNDAIFSIANYLRGNGWREAANRTDQEAVIYRYNRSRPYIEAVLGVADRLR